MQALHGMDLPQPRVAPSSFVCEGCIEGKQQPLPFPVDKATCATKPLKLVHSDICSPTETTSIGAVKYFVSFIDDFSSKIWIFPIKLKNECFDKFNVFKAFVNNQCKKKMKMMLLDNGDEFMSNQFGEFLKKKGIARQKSTPYTPEQNGVAKRANQTIVAMARCMLHAQNLNLDLWAEAMVNAVCTSN